MKTIASARGWLPAFMLLLAIGAGVRLVNLNAPPLDFHSTRQLRNSLVARAIYYDLLPGATAQQRSLAESFRRAVGTYEPPISESLSAITFLVTGGESFAVPRIYATLFWLLAGVVLFDMARRITSPAAALVALAFYLVLPFAVQASRSFQPDPLMTASFVAGLYFLCRWVESAALAQATHPRDEGAWKWAILAGVFLGLAALIKIVIAFLIVGAAVAAVLTAYHWRFWRSPQVWTMAALMALPAFGYYVLGHPGRSTEYFFSWTVDLIRLITSPHFYADWLGFVGSLFGLTSLLLAAIGTLMAPARVRWLLIGCWIGYLLYGLSLPFQMFTHSYYHIQIVPLVALGLAPVAEAVFSRMVTSPLWVRAALAISLAAAVGYQAWAARSALVVEDFSDAPGFWKSVAAALPGNADVMGLTQDYGYDLMYWGWRKVDLWPLATDLSSIKHSGKDPAADFASMTSGDSYFLVTAFGQLDQQPNLKKVLQSYPVAAQGNGFIVYDLKK